VELILLQTLPVIDQGSSTTTIVGIALFAAFALLLIIAGVSTSGGSAGKGGGGSKKYSRRKFRRYATSRGLTRGEIRVLEQQIKRQRIQRPFSLLNNSPALDSLLNRAISGLQESQMDQDEQEAYKLTLYRIKQKVERSTKGTKPPSSTRQLRLGQQLFLSVGDNRYPSKVTSSLQKSLGVMVPTDRQGGEIRWKKWTRVQVFFWRNNGQGFFFETKVLGYNMIRGSSSLFLQHTSGIKEGKQRRFRRKELDRPAYFYPIRIITEGSGKNQSRKAVVENRKGSLGTILEVSAGGCSIRTSYPLGRGELLKLEFETERNQQVTVFGKVRGMQRQNPTGGIMHIMFTRISRSNLNKLNDYIYSFSASSAEKRVPRF
jgi:hypothetical protein